MKLSLGPLQYYWPRLTTFDFYEAMAATPVDIVHLGEVTCSRRHELRLSDWLDMAKLLRDAGKEVVLSTMVLLESGADVGAMHKITAQNEHGVEANDMGAVHSLHGHSRHFVAGPHLNIYNPPTLQWMHGMGATRWVAPLEMPRSDLALMQAARPPGMETEVFAHGRLPLAYSARCFTARHCNLPKDECQFRCMEHPDGLMLKTREDAEFLVLNGIQTQSARVHSLIDAWDDLLALGVEVARISPQSAHTAEVIALFDAVRRQTMSRAQAHDALLPLLPAEDCNGYWHGRPGLERIDATTAVAA